MIDARHAREGVAAARGRGENERRRDRGDDDAASHWPKKERTSVATNGSMASAKCFIVSWFSPKIRKRSFSIAVDIETTVSWGTSVSPASSSSGGATVRRPSRTRQFAVGY